MTSPPITNADIDWQDGLPRSATFGDIYFSREDAIAETTHVFLHGNDLERRFSGATGAFVIGECGFGSGLNFLCTWRLWQKTAPPGARLYYLSTEQFPLTLDDLHRFHALWPELVSFCQQLQAVYPEQGQGLHRLVLGTHDRPVFLDLLYGETGAQFASLVPTHAGRIDAWYLDGFAPRANPAMWSTELFRTLADLSHGATTLATYSVAGMVRSGLGEAGFRVEKHPGFGNKKHMLRANMMSGSPCHQPVSKAKQRVCIIGAGLAGCSLAHALALKGYSPVVLDQAAGLASGASGNPRGVMFLPLHREASARATLLRQCFLYARRRYQVLCDEHGSIDWQPAGALQLTRKNSEDYFERVAANPDYFPALARLVDGKEASQLAGVDITQDALWLSLCGTLKPARLCIAWLDHPAISIRTSVRVESLKRKGDIWHLYDTQGALIASCDVAVVANAVDARRLLESHDYPLFPNRGQLSVFPANTQSSALKTVLCGRGYLAPEYDGEHVCGGSFNPGDADTDLRNEDDARNLALLAELCPAAGSWFTACDASQSRAALRCTTRDYLPLAGPVEKRSDSQNGENSAGTKYLDGLFLFTGLGSHGITTSPLLAEWLASLIATDPLPLTTELAELIEPARFYRREKRRAGQG